MSQLVSAAAAATKNKRPIIKHGSVKTFWKNHGYTGTAIPNNKCTNGLNVILQCGFGSEKDKAGHKKDDSAEGGFSPEEYEKLHEVYAADFALMDDSNPKSRLSFVSKMQNLQLTSLEILNKAKQEMNEKNDQQQQTHKTELENLTNQLNGLETNTTNTSKLVVKVREDLVTTATEIANIIGGLVASVSTAYDDKEKEDPLQFWADQTLVYMDAVDLLDVKVVKPVDLSKAFHLESDTNRLVPNPEWIWPAEESSKAAEKASKAAGDGVQVQPQEDTYTGPITKYHLVRMLHDLSSTVAQQGQTIVTLQQQMADKVDKTTIETVQKKCKDATTACKTATEACTKATGECKQATTDCTLTTGATEAVRKLLEDTAAKQLETEKVVKDSKAILDQVGRITPETIGLLSNKEAITALTSENKKREREETLIKSVDELVQSSKRARVENNDMGELKKLVESLARSTKVWVDGITTTVTPLREDGGGFSSPSPP